MAPRIVLRAAPKEKGFQSRAGATSFRPPAIRTGCLRFAAAGYPATTQDSLRAAGQALPDALSTGRVPRKGLKAASLCPFPSLLGAITSSEVSKREPPRRVGRPRWSHLPPEVCSRRCASLMRARRRHVSKAIWPIGRSAKYIPVADFREFLGSRRTASSPVRWSSGGGISALARSISTSLPRTGRDGQTPTAKYRRYS